MVCLCECILKKFLPCLDVLANVLRGVWCVVCALAFLQTWNELNEEMDNNLPIFKFAPLDKVLVAD